MDLVYSAVLLADRDDDISESEYDVILEMSKEYKVEKELDPFIEKIKKQKVKEP